MKAKNSFSVVFNNGTSLMIENVRKVYGHDDSFPFNADFTLLSPNVEPMMSGIAWNDGWGGDAVVKVENGKEHLDALDEYMKKRLSYSGDGYEVSLSFVLDTLAPIIVENEEQLNGHYILEQSLHEFLEGGEFKFSIMPY